MNKLFFTPLFLLFCITSFAQIPTGSKLWLKADAGVTVTSGVVSAWADQSGGGNNATQATAGNRPTLVSGVLSGKPVIRFTAGAKFLEVPAINLSSTDKVSVFMVYKMSGTAPSVVFENSTDISGTNTGFLITDKDNTSPGLLSNAAATLAGNVGASLNGSATNIATYKLLEAQYDKGLTTEEAKLLINGILSPKLLGTLNADNTNNFGTNQSFIGARSGGSYPFIGDIAEIVVYDRVLNSTDRTQIQNYLNTKYNLNAATIGTGLKPTLWLKADAGITQTAGSVSAWADQSGNGFNVTQGTLASRPTFEATAFNGQPALSFDGGDWLGNTVSNVVTSGAGRTVFIVSKARCNSTAMYPLTFRRSALLCAYQSAPANNIYSDGSNAVNNASIASSYFETLKTNPTLNTFYNYASGPLGAKLNGQYIVVTQAGNVSAETGSTGFSVGTRQDGTYNTNGWISEIVVFDYLIDGAEVSEVENYLAAKYGTNNQAAVSSFKPTEATATYAPYPQNNANDDNVCTAWNCGNSAVNSFTIDLQTPQTINRIITIPAINNGSTFTANAFIQVSPDGTTWTNVLNLLGMTFPFYKQVVTELNNPIPNIRYVRYTGTSGTISWHGLYELLVNPDLINKQVKDLTPIILNSNGSFNDGTFIIGQTYYASKAFTYQWRRNGVNISGAINQSYIVTQPGTYTVTVTYECSGACNTALTSPSSNSGLPPNAIPTCALQQTGGAAGITVPHNAALQSSNFTYEAWFKASADVSSTRHIIEKGVFPTNYFASLNIYVGTGKIYAQSNIGGTDRVVQSVGSYNDDKWHHTAFTYDGANLKLYVDGELDAILAITGAVAISNEQLSIGRYNPGSGAANNFIGSIDEVRIWNVARTQAQIQATIGTVLAGNETGLVAYYNFNDNLFNGQNRLVPNKCTTTGVALNGTTYGTATTPTFSCASAPFSEPDCTMGLVSTGNFIDVPHNAALSSNTFTVAAYVKTNQAATAFARVLVKPAGTLQQNYSLCINNGKAHIRFDHSGGAVAAEGTTNVNDNIWHYIAGTYDGVNLKIYVDGTLQATTASTFTPLTSTQNMQIGQNAGTQQLICRMDQLAVYNLALTQAQIQGNMGYNLAGNEAGLVAYYNFNDNRVNGTAQSVINKATAIGAALNGITSGGATTPNFSCVEVVPNRPTCSIMQSGYGAGKIVKLNTNNNFTMEFIVKPQSSQYQGLNNISDDGYLIGKRPLLGGSGGVWPGNTTGLDVCVARNSIEVWQSSGFYYHSGVHGYTSPTDLQDWVHIAISSSTTGTKLYVNGVPINSASTYPTVNYVIYPAFTGQFLGNIAEARFWDRTLTGTEINANVNTVYTGTETDLKALYRFNSNTVNGGGQTITNLGSLGAAANLTTEGTSTQTPIFTCANYAPNTTNEAKNLPGSGLMIQSGVNNARGVVNLNSWGTMPNTGSISFWFKPAVVDVSSPNQNIFSTAAFTQTKGGNRGIRVELNGTGQLSAIFGNDNSTTHATTNIFGINGSQTIEANKWYHVTLTFNKTANTFSSYLNGINTNLNVTNTLWPSMYRDINIGEGYEASLAYTYTNGWFDELTHYNIELTQTQVRERMARKLTSTDALWANVLNYYRFDNSPTISNVIYDYKGRKHGMNFDYSYLITSAAPIGDTSFYDYNGIGSFAKVTTGISGKDTIAATILTGTNVQAVHVYGVHEKPNTQNGQIQLLNNNRYGGVFVVGDTNQLSVNTKYSYALNPFVLPANINDQLLLYKRNDNAGGTWVIDATSTIDSIAKTYSSIGRNAEIMLGYSNVPVRPRLGNDTIVYVVCAADTRRIDTLYKTAAFTTAWTTNPLAAPIGNHRLIATSAYGFKDTAFVQVKQDVVVWNGSTSSDWHTAANWNGGKVPTLVSHVIIPIGTVNICEIINADAEAASVQAFSGSINVVSGRRLLIAANCPTLPPAP